MLYKYRVNYEMYVTGVYRLWFKKRERINTFEDYEIVIAHNEEGAIQKAKIQIDKFIQNERKQINNAVEQGKCYIFELRWRMDGICYNSISNINYLITGVRITTDYSKATIKQCVEDLTPAQFKECFGYMCPLSEIK